ncbi:puratrophin-1 [Elgaria multicarinata webbii]|uniref:puratrophin-1 n=1 Tax=Elgaria multicarinata webbii TaxID=159646 RepID=UPI002FCD1CF1
MDSQSLDGCIQSTLSVLYPPFKITAATVLCQVFDVVEKTYCGDGLRYLIDFLIPAKHILQCVQQDACVQYCGLLFRHEGWPLCIHEKIVVQLASLDWRILRPGDFYLQVVPYLKKSPQVIVKCLAKDKHNVEELVVPEVSYTSIFTAEWLSCINKERVGTALENCLLASDDNIFRVPWEKIVNPEFISKPQTMEKNASSAPVPQWSSSLAFAVEQRQSSPPEVGPPFSRGPGDNVFMAITEESAREAASKECASPVLGEDPEWDLEREYVELTDVSLPTCGPPRGSTTQSVAPGYCTKPRRRAEKRPVASQDSSTRLQNGLCLALTAEPHRQRETSDGQASRAGNCLKKKNETGRDKLLLNGSEEHPGSVFANVASEASGIDEPSHAQLLQAHVEHELDWRYAMCSYNDGEEGAERKPPTAPETSETTAIAQRSSSELENSHRGSEHCSGVLGMEAAQELGSSSMRSGKELLSGSHMRHLTVCHSCEETSGSSRLSLQENAFPPPTTTSLLPEPSSGVRVAHSPISQKPSDGVAGHCSEQLVLHPLPEQMEKMGPRQADKLAGLGRGLTGDGIPPWLASQSLPDNERQPSSRHPFPLKGQAAEYLLEEAGQENGGRCPQPAEGASLLSTSGTMQNSPVAKQKGDSSSSPSGEAEAQAEGTSSHGNKEGTAVAAAGWMGQPREPKTRLLGASQELERLPGQSVGSNQASSPKEESGIWTLLKTGFQPAPLEPPEQCQPNRPEMEDADAPSAPLTLSLPGSTRHGTSGDPITETSLKWAKKVNGGAGKVALVSDYCDCSWEEGLASTALQEPSPFPSSGSLRTAPTSVKEVNWEVLRSGVACLPGTRDKYGRAVIIVTMRNTAWLNPHCNASELTRLLLYLRSILRPECQALGLTILIDARRCSPVPALFKAFAILQDTVPHCIHGALLLVEKDFTFRMEKLPSVQCEVLTSMKSLHKHIENMQLPLEFDGSVPYCHQDWLRFRMRLEHLLQGCRGACVFLEGAIQAVESSRWPDKAEEADTLLKNDRQLMKMVLEDARLVRLQLEGGALLARLRKEESCVTLSEGDRDTLEAAGALYNRVDEGIHQLVLVSNKRIQALELVMEFEAFDICFREVGGWIENVGQTRLTELSEADDALEAVLQAQHQLQDFERVASEYCQKGWEALRKVESQWEDFPSVEPLEGCEVKLQRCRNQLQGFCRQLEASRSRLDQAVELYAFLDQASEWAFEGMHHLASISMEGCSSLEQCSAAIVSLESYCQQHPKISDAKFQEMKELACRLKSSKALARWQFAWSKCQETMMGFGIKLEAALGTRRSLRLDCEPSLEGESDWPGQEGRLHLEGAARTTCSGPAPFHKRPICPPGWAGERVVGCAEHARTEEQPVLQAAPRGRGGTPEASALPCCVRRGQGPLGSIVEVLAAASSRPETPTSQQPSPKRPLRKAQSFDLPCAESLRSGCQRTLSEPSHHGNTGVFIRGLEVSSTELGERTCGAQPHPISARWAAGGITPEERPSSVPLLEAKSWGSKLRHIIDEMVTTEQEYVRSLRYVIESYFPEMERVDLPQDLRGKRSVIFGNLEKLYDFHSQYFLRELEHCCNHPLRVSHCFLRHKDQFGLYALYSKNKPKSDLLLAGHGNAFFRFKQLQLGDKMDLASYLLKPIQRMSKYGLLLKDLTRQCGEAQEQELFYLRAAEEMVRFQLRHGNDLLAMDAIRDCDVNLKEQGQLVRQDEFSVSVGRRKCQRHVFLFEDLILFSKPKRIERGLDVYIYKRSFKTADIGLTETSGESGLRFEIWFRRRKSSDTYVLQAGSTETKQAWTSDITRILWEQAARNKEIRLQEMVSMGVGNKPFLDIKPSEAAIHDRAIDYIMKGRGARTRASIAVSLFDHANPYKRSQAALPAGGPSSCSVLAPLNLHMYLDQALLPSVLAKSCPFDAGACVEEDEVENETSSQPSLTTESSESSTSQCLSGSGSTGSDSGCVSSIPQESFCDNLGPPLFSSAGSSLAPQPEEKPCFPKSQYVSAV